MPEEPTPPMILKLGLEMIMRLVGDAAKTLDGLSRFSLEGRISIPERAVRRMLERGEVSPEKIDLIVDMLALVEKLGNLPEVKHIKKRCETFVIIAKKTKS